MYENIKIFKLIDSDKNTVYYGHTKINLSSKLAEMRYLYKIKRNYNKFKSVFDTYGPDNLTIGLVDVSSFNDIDEVNRKIRELSCGINEIHQKVPIPIQTLEPQPIINYNTPKKSFNSLINLIA